MTDDVHRLTTVAPSAFFAELFPLKRSRSTQDPYLINLGSTGVLNAIFLVSRTSINWFWESKFLNIFTIHDSHLGHVTQLNFFSVFIPFLDVK